VNRELIVSRYYELGDEGACVELFAEDVRYERPGRAAIEDRGALWSSTRRDGCHEFESVVADGATVAARGRFAGRQGDETVTFALSDFHEFDGDRIARRYTFTDLEEV